MDQRLPGKPANLSRGQQRLLAGNPSFFFIFLKACWFNSQSHPQKPRSSKKIDWHNYKQLEEELKQTGTTFILPDIHFSFCLTYKLMTCQVLENRGSLTTYPLRMTKSKTLCIKSMVSMPWLVIESISTEHLRTLDIPSKLSNSLTALLFAHVALI